MANLLKAVGEAVGDALPLKHRNPAKDLLQELDALEGDPSKSKKSKALSRRNFLIGKIAESLASESGERIREDIASTMHTSHMLGPLLMDISSMTVETVEAFKDIMLYMLSWKPSDLPESEFLPVVDYIHNHPVIITSVLQQYDDEDRYIFIAVIIRAMIKHRRLARYMLQPKTILNMLNAVRVSEDYSWSIETLELFKMLCVEQKALCASFLEESYTEFFSMYSTLMTSEKFHVKQFCLELLGEHLLTLSEYKKVLIMFTKDQTQLITVMKLMADPLPSTVRLAYRLFILFVANPKKPPTISSILFNNRSQLLSFLENLPAGDGEADRGFVKDKSYVIGKLKKLEAPSPSASDAPAHGGTSAESKRKKKDKASSEFSNQPTNVSTESEASSEEDDMVKEKTRNKKERVNKKGKKERVQMGSEKAEKTLSGKKGVMENSLDPVDSIDGPAVVDGASVPSKSSASETNDIPPIKPRRRSSSKLKRVKVTTTGSSDRDSPDKKQGKKKKKPQKEPSNDHQEELSNEVLDDADGDDGTTDSLDSKGSEGSPQPLRSKKKVKRTPSWKDRGTKDGKGNPTRHGKHHHAKDKGDGGVSGNGRIKNAKGKEMESDKATEEDSPPKEIEEKVLPKPRSGSFRNLAGVVKAKATRRNKKDREDEEDIHARELDDQTSTSSSSTTSEEV